MSVEAARTATVEHLQHAQGLLAALHRHGQDRAGQIAGAFGDVTGKAWVGATSLSSIDWPEGEHPPGDPAAGRDAHAHHYLGASGRGGDEL